MATDRPLDGVRVLDLTNVLAGPFACHQLAHLGADVIKVEAVGRGDLARSLGASPALSAKGMGISFLAQNAGKRSVTLNLKSEEGSAILRRMVKEADVLVENFRPGVMARLGLDAEVLRADNPRLIYCAISGFGQTGPWASRPAYDQIIQGAAGVMSVTGTDSSGPLRVGFPLADTVGGLTAAMAITAALNAKDRGCVIDVAMLDAVLATMGWVVSNEVIGGVPATRHGNENPTSAPSGAFQCADGLINIAANSDAQWESLARHLGRDDLLDQSHYATREDRKANRLRLKAELETVLTTRPAQAWEAELNAIGVPAGAVLSVNAVLNHSQITDRDFFSHFTDIPDVVQPIALARVGAMVDGVRPSVPTPPPALGQDTDAILGEMGYSPAEISKLREMGAI